MSGNNWLRLNFPTADEVKRAKDRGALLTEEDKAVLVEEANVVFRYNIAIFEELEGRTLEAMFSLALASLRDRFKL